MSSDHNSHSIVEEKRLYLSQTPSEESSLSEGVSNIAEGVSHIKLGAPLTVSIIGAGYKGGQPLSGCELGPNEIRKYLNYSQIEEIGWRIEDAGNLPFREVENDEPTVEGIKNPRNVGGACKLIADHVTRQAEQKRLCLTLGGDHSLAIGTIAGVTAVHPDLGILWIDAHADINLPETSPSGNIHGMPLAYLMGLFDTSTIPGFEWLKPCITNKQVAFIGLRDVDAGEKKILKKFGIKAFSMSEVDKYGIVKVMELALQHIDPENKRPIHLSFDVDAIDPTLVPSTGTRVKGGLNFREARYICETVHQTTRLVSCDIVEVNPSIGTSEDVQITAETAVELIKFTLGATLL